MNVERVVTKHVNKDKEDPTYDIKPYWQSNKSAPSFLPILELKNRITS